MSLTKLSLAGNSWIIPGQGKFGKWYPGWRRKIFFYGVQSGLNYISLGKIIVIHTWSSPHGTVVWKLFILIIFPSQVFFPNNPQLTKFLSLLHMYCTIFIVHIPNVRQLITQYDILLILAPYWDKLHSHRPPPFAMVYAIMDLSTCILYAQKKLRMQVWDSKTSAVLGPDRKFLQKGGSPWFLPVTYFCVQNQLGLLAWGSTWCRLCHVTYFVCRIC